MTEYVQVNGAKVATADGVVLGKSKLINPFDEIAERTARETGLSVDQLRMKFEQAHLDAYSITRHLPNFSNRNGGLKIDAGQVDNLFNEVTRVIAANTGKDIPEVAEAFSKAGLGADYFNGLFSGYQMGSHSRDPVELNNQLEGRRVAVLQNDAGEITVVRQTTDGQYRFSQKSTPAFEAAANNAVRQFVIEPHMAYRSSYNGGGSSLQHALLAVAAQEVGKTTGGYGQTYGTYRDGEIARIDISAPLPAKPDAFTM